MQSTGMDPEVDFRRERIVCFVIVMSNSIEKVNKSLPPPYINTKINL